MSTSLKLTVAEYDQMMATGAFDRLDKRVDLIYGELREMNPAGPLHEDIICFLTRWSTENTSVEDILVRVQMSVGIPALDSVPEPDLSWVRSGSYRQRRPEPDAVLLVIEVADSSLEYDLGDKLKLYAAAGIREYWVVNLQQQRIAVLREPAESGYRLTKAFALGESLSPLAVPKAKLDVAELSRNWGEWIVTQRPTEKPSRTFLSLPLCWRTSLPADVGAQAHRQLVAKSWPKCAGPRLPQNTESTSGDCFTC